MRTLLTFALLVVAGAGCKPGTNGNSSGTAPATVQSIAPPSFIVPDETTELIAIRQQARTLIEARKFEEIEQLARKYRDPKEQQADGTWRLVAVYSGLSLEGSAAEDRWRSWFKLMADWTKARPESITARVALADNYSTYGWRARGGGTASTVTPAARKLFTERLRQSFATLEGAKQLQEKCPHWGSVMLEVARGLNFEKPQFDKVFENASNAYTNHSGYAVAKMVYLLPRWQGKPGDLEIFLDQAANTIGGEEGDLLYARACWQFQRLASVRNIYRESRLSSGRADKGFEVMISRYPNSVRAKNARALLATMGTNPQLTIEAFAALKGQVDLSVWGTRENYEAAFAAISTASQ